MEKLKKLLTCSICKDPLVNAVNLEPCHHIFCSYCLLEAKTASCPLCRANIVNIHSCSKVFMREMVEIVFENEYVEAVSYKLKCNYENSIKREILANLPKPQVNTIIRQIPVHSPNTNSNTASYIIIGIFSLLISLMLINTFFLQNISKSCGINVNNS